MSDHPYREGAELTRQIVVTTGNDVAYPQIDTYLGIVRGIVVRSPSIAQGFVGAAGITEVLAYGTAVLTVAER